MFQTGYVTLGRVYNVPIRLHWSAAVGALIFGRFRFVPGFWLGFFGLILVHELGHLLLVRARKLRALEVVVHGFGGHCKHEAGSPYDQAIIAWGGVLAQFLILYIPTRILLALGHWPAGAWSHQLLGALLDTNLFLILFNLAPFPPLDGAWAWKLPGMWMEKRRRRRAKAWKAAPIRVEEGAGNESPEDAARRIAQEALEKAKRGID